jgi:hypothetical protein
MCVVGVVVLAIAGVAATVFGGSRRTGLASEPNRPALLEHAVARGTLVSVDRRTLVATFRVSCGWHVSHSGLATTTKLRPGLYGVSVRRAFFNVGDYTSSSMVSLAGWERSTGGGWKAWLDLRGGRPALSSGPSFDVCGGHLG